MTEGLLFAADLAEDEYIAVYGFAVNRVSRFTSGVDGEIYLFNAHGDVVGLVAISGENVGKTIKEYDYDAFGNEVFPDPDDENPFRYCGEYYDKGTNRLYLRARDYDASTGRFTQQDGWGYGDIKDPLSLNLYAYCYNNPVAWVDPSGHKVVLSGTREEQIAMLDTMRELSDYPLAMTEDGIVYIPVYTKVAKEYGEPIPNRPNSTKIITDILNADETVTIVNSEYLPDDWNGFKHEELTIYINIFLSEDSLPKYLTVDPETRLLTGYVPTPLHIILAHEIIHANRFFLGLRNTTPLKTKVFANIPSNYGGTYSVDVSTSYEEFATVGLFATKKENGYITENDIRREFRMNPRFSY